MAARIIIEEGDHKGLSLSLETGDQWTIGRSPEESQFVIDDPIISRQHIILQRTENGFSAKNLSHTNPTLLNDEPMTDEAQLLENGDTLKIGNEVLRFYEDVDAHIMDDENDEVIDIEEAEEFLDEENLPEEVSTPVESPEITPQPTSEEPMKEINTFEEEASIEQPELTTPRHTIFAEDEAEMGQLAEIDFGIAEEGRWLLKVIGGPNAGAEFHMQTGNNYILGTDASSSDIVFHDTSVSRQHARISISPEDALTIEDLRSRNGVLIGGVPVEHKQTLLPSTIVTLGTTSFAVYDREGEMQTIISPLLPSIVKVLQQQPGKTGEEESEGLEETTDVPPEIESSLSGTDTTGRRNGDRSFTNFIILTAVVGLFGLAAIGTTSLFRSEPVVLQSHENADELIKEALQPFPAVRYTYNKGKDSILLIGHVINTADKNQLLFNLQALKFIKSIDDSGIIIDETVWHEVNSILSDNPAWRGITVHSPRAGQFVLSGHLETRRQAEQLSAYISLNFPYLDLLTKQIIVEENVIGRVNEILQNSNLLNVAPKMNNGEIILTGTVPQDHPESVMKAIEQIKAIPGVRVVINSTKAQLVEPDVLNITGQYQIAGKSQVGSKYTVVINGRILSEGDDLDGMTILSITRNRIMLEKEGQKFRIDY